MHKNYYKVLGLHPSANMDDIKSAYRTLAKNFHPDKSTNGLAFKFREITEAYNVLSNPEKKKKYDLENKPIGKDSFNGPYRFQKDLNMKENSTTTVKEVLRTDKFNFRILIKPIVFFVLALVITFLIMRNF